MDAPNNLMFSFDEVPFQQVSTHQGFSDFHRAVSPRLPRSNPKLDENYWMISPCQEAVVSTYPTTETSTMGFVPSLESSDFEFLHQLRSTIEPSKDNADLTERSNPQQIQLKRLDSPMHKKSYLHTMELQEHSSSATSPSTSEKPTTFLPFINQTDTVSFKERMVNDDDANLGKVKGSRSCTSKAKFPRDMSCYNCGVTSTPLWRRTPDRQHSLCNACGLYFKQYKTHRPLHIHQKGSKLCMTSTEMEKVDSNSSLVKHKPTHNLKDSVESPNSGADLICVNCSQTHTPLWRKNEKGEPICNACGLYAKLHNKERPSTLHRSKVQRRRKDWSHLQSRQYHEMINFLGMNEEKFKQSLKRLTSEELLRWHKFFEGRAVALKSLMEDFQST